MNGTATSTERGTVRVSNLRKSFIRKSDNHESVAIDGISFEVPSGSFFTLLGPSGCGKTTTLRCIAGLETPDDGEIRMGSDVVFSEETRRRLSPEARPIAMVPQSYGIWPHMTVYDNAAFPLRYGRYRVSSDEAQPRVRAILEQMGIGDLSDKWATQLSGGQQQRLALARSLLGEPEVLLLDEPLSNLDAKLRDQLRQELREFQQGYGITSIYVTHDQAEALAMSDTVAIMNAGRIEQIGSPIEVYNFPRTRFAAKFLGNANLVPATVVKTSPEQTVVETKFGNVRCRSMDASEGVPASNGDSVEVSIRPEHVDVEPSATELPGDANCFQGEILSAEFLGDRYSLVVDVGGHEFMAQRATSSHLAFHKGDAVGVRLDPDWTRCLSE